MDLFPDTIIRPAPEDLSGLSFDLERKHPDEGRLTELVLDSELTTREYDRTIAVPNGKKSIQHTIKQLAVELKADTIHVLDRSEQSDATEPPLDSEVPC